MKKVYLRVFVEVVKQTYGKMAEQLQQIREVLDGLTRSDMKRVAQNAEEAIDWNELSDAGEVKRLFGVLASYRALKLIKHTPEENGYEAWTAAERHAAEHKAEGIGFDDPTVEDHLCPEQVHHGAAPGLRSPGQGVREGLIAGVPNCR